MSYRYKVIFIDEAGKQNVLESTNNLELAKSFKDALIERDKLMRRLKHRTNIPILTFEILDNGQKI